MIYIDIRYNLKQIQIDDPTNVSGPLKALIGKTFQFLVSIEKDNIDGGLDVYKVSKIWSGTEMIKVDSESYSELHIEHSHNLFVDQVSLFTHLDESYFILL